MPKRYAIIVAGGTGKRMNHDLPKQFIKIGVLPVVMHTLLRFYHFDSQIKIILVLPEDYQEKWEKLCIKYDFKVPLVITEGGDTRFQSVKSGLKCIPDGDGIVAIHDGVRPFINKKILKEAYDFAKKWGNAVTSVKLKESVRVINNDRDLPASRAFVQGKHASNEAVDRNNFRLIQTPQCFSIPLIKRAYEQQEANDITDDAGLVEKLGVKIHLIEGSYENIKITTPVDLLYAEAILQLKIEEYEEILK
ncbi:MAG: 2-C-methyl-D-erythritol 4-phosphate cytidylyltransferase [Bacteroidetes bacterium]|nr:2-C-methyl-D-erythritol 4-phosphate cytidylyltransferase [Bacteroidota bacterium]